MPEISETRLPGVGIRHDFVTEHGTRVGVVSHRAGYRELLVYDPDDPDRCEETVRLTDADSQALAELLGASRVVDRLAHLQQSVEGLVIDWLPIDDSSVSAGRTIADFGVRSATGVSIVAVLRGDETFPAPAPNFGLQARDTVIVVGTPEGVRATFKLLQGH